MKGLLIKDVKIMLLQKKFFLLLLLITMGLLISSDNISFPLGFFPSIVSLFALTTISYDELDNGQAFLFVLPVTRKEYVMEKYGLGLLLVIPSLLLIALFAALVSIFKGNLQLADLWRLAGFIFPMLLFIQAMMFPIQLKYGAEKGRMVLMGAIGVVMFVVMGLRSILKIEPNQLFQNLSSINTNLLLVLWILFGVVAFFFSMKWSMTIMEKKEF